MNERLAGYLENRSKSFFLYSGLIIILMIGTSEYFIGYGISISIFYLVPLSLTAWYAGKNAGRILAVISAAVWLALDLLSSNPATPRYIPFWNAAVRLSLFFVTVSLLDQFKREKIYARKDYLTGIGNRRDFIERAEAEIKRSRRYLHPLTVAYIDIDNFKWINDQFGHNEGDAVLKNVGRVIRNNIRETDIEGRLGGDEFGLLLAETGADMAARFISKLHKKLSETTSLELAVTFSIGAVTFTTLPESINEILKIVDHVMYAAKEKGKNLVVYKVV